MKYHASDLKLQFLGVAAEHYSPSAVQALGPVLDLPAGTFSDSKHQLGVCNLDTIDLPEALLNAKWLLTGYRLCFGDRHMDLKLADCQRMDQLPLPLIPPCCIQPASELQPVFRVSTLMRNPCPGWSERIHLYMNPAERFFATSVAYLDAGGRIGSVELFDKPLRNPRHPSYQRIWIGLSY